MGYFVEGLSGGDLVDDDGAVCVAVVDGGDCIVLLLAGGVLVVICGCTQMASLTALPLLSVTFF